MSDNNYFDDDGTRSITDHLGEIARGSVPTFRERKVIDAESVYEHIDAIEKKIDDLLFMLGGNELVPSREDLSKINQFLEGER